MKNDMENSIIKIQRRFNKLKNEIRYLNYSITFIRDYLLGMVNNLVYLNNLKVFQEPKLFISLLNELKLIKDEMNKLPQVIYLKDLKMKTLKYYRLELIKINNLLLKYSNHITSEHFSSVLVLFINTFWLDSFLNIDIDKILFITQFIRPISVWDSYYHKVELPYDIIDKKEETPKDVTKEIIESILGFAVRNEENTEPKTFFIKSVDFVDTKKKSNTFDKIDCINILLDENIKIMKTNNRNGVNIYIRVNNRIMVVQGIVNDDLLNLSYNNKFVQKNLHYIKVH